MIIDMRRLRADLAAVAIEAKATKKLLRTTWTQPMHDEQRRLVRLRLRATDLGVLLASLRKRKHCRNRDDAWHASVAARVAKDYSLEAA